MILLSFIILFIIGDCQRCPSRSYQECASEGGRCSIYDGIKQGYMSYGVNGRYVLIPFTNSRTDGRNLEIKCNNDLGDVSKGNKKYCCYTRETVDTGFKASGYRGSLSEGRNWQHHANRVVTQRYGANGQYVYRSYYKSKGYCKNNHFGDPYPGSKKHCNYAFYAPPSLANVPNSGNGAWRLCANEGQRCNGLDIGATQWIRYGDNNVFYYKLVISSSGYVDCNNHLFEDPIKQKKHCWYSPAQYTFKDIVGQWRPVTEHCFGCSTNRYKSTFGVSNKKESEITNTWGWSLTTTASASYKFKIGVEASASLSTTVSTDVARRELSSTTWTEEKSQEFWCDKNYLYQWRTTMTENNGVRSQSVAVSSAAIVCSTSHKTPRCPPLYCADATCQRCNRNIYADSPILDIKPVEPEYPEPTEWKMPYTISPFYLYGLVGAIAVLIVVNILCVCCTKCHNGDRKQYKTLSVDSDNESSV